MVIDGLYRHLDVELQLLIKTPGGSLARSEPEGYRKAKGEGPVNQPAEKLVLFLF